MGCAGPATLPYADVTCFNRHDVKTNSAFTIQFVIAP